MNKRLKHIAIENKNIIDKSEQMFKKKKKKETI